MLRLNTHIFVTFSYTDFSKDVTSNQLYYNTSKFAKMVIFKNFKIKLICSTCCMYLADADLFSLNFYFRLWFNVPFSIYDLSANYLTDYILYIVISFYKSVTMFIHVKCGFVSNLIRVRLVKVLKSGIDKYLIFSWFANHKLYF